MGYRYLFTQDTRSLWVKNQSYSCNRHCQLPPPPDMATLLVPDQS